MSIAESPRAGDGWDGLSASLGILSAAASARHDVLGGLPTPPLAGAPGGAATPPHQQQQQAQQQLSAGEMEQLSSRFGGLALDGSGKGNDAAGGPDPAADPFAAASHLVSSLRGSSATSESHGIQILCLLKRPLFLVGGVGCDCEVCRLGASCPWLWQPPPVFNQPFPFPAHNCRQPHVAGRHS